MQMEAGLDTGPVLLRRETPISDTETTGALHDRLSLMGAAAIVNALSVLDTLVPTPQPDDGVTYANKIDKSEARIDWRQPAAQIIRQINGLSPFPGAWTDAAGERIKLLSAGSSDIATTPAQIVAMEGSLHIGAADGAVQIHTLQRSGKKSGPARDVLLGWMPPPAFS